MVEFRYASIEDIDNGLLELYMDGFNIHHDNRPEYFERCNEGCSRRELLNLIGNGNMFLLMVLDGKIIGYLQYKLNGVNKDIIWISQFVISSLYRGKGYGKRLFDEVKKIGRSLGYKRVELNCWSFNERAINFYKKIGFNEQRVIFEFDLNE